MKIGVALSGCDIGGVGAYAALRELEDQGFEVGMVSACGVPAVAALLYAVGRQPRECDKHTECFLDTARNVDMDMAVAELAARLPDHRLASHVPLVVSSVNISDGCICAFTSDYQIVSKRLRTFPLEDAYDALSAAISPVEGLASYPYDGCHLCDFSVWYGAPVYPLKMAGIDRLVSVSFLPKCPRTAYEALVKQRLLASAHLADVHILIELDGEGSFSQYIETAAEGVRRHTGNIHRKF